MKISEIKKGCGTEVDVIEDSFGDGDLIVCGEYVIRKSNQERVLRLCPSCQAKLTQAIEDTKEEIEFLKSISKRDYRNVNKTMEQVDERIKQKEAEIK